MLSCWVSIGSDEGRGSAFMARLLDGRESIRRSLPETAIGKKSMKLYKPNHRNARLAHLHVGAQRTVQHQLRSEERRVGNERVSTWQPRRSTETSKKKKNKTKT